MKELPANDSHWMDYFKFLEYFKRSQVVSESNPNVVNTVYKVLHSNVGNRFVYLFLVVKYLLISKIILMFLLLDFLLLLCKA